LPAAVATERAGYHQERKKKGEGLPENANVFHGWFFIFEMV